MKHRTFFALAPSALVLALALGLAVTGCSQTSDLPPMQEEANGIVTNYAPRLEDLSRRGASLDQRGGAIRVSTPDAANALQLFRTTSGRLAELRGIVETAPGAINTATATGKPLELQRVMDSLRQRLDRGFTEVSANLDAVENWIENAERVRSEPAGTARSGAAPTSSTPPGAAGTRGAGGTAPTP